MTSSSGRRRPHVVSDKMLTSQRELNLHERSRPNDTTLHDRDSDSIMLLVGDEGSNCCVNGDDAKPIALASAEQTPAQPSSKRPKASKILFLDGMRGLAVLLVVAHHAGYSRDINVGGIGVDIFFVLSSFLLTMILDKKCRQLFKQQASYPKWCFAMADYFSKRFLRVYPLFAIVAVVIWMLPNHMRELYFMVHRPYDLIKVLTFRPYYTYHMLWTLPVEISYYFLIPVFVVGTIKLRQLWWVAFALLYVWIVHQGLHTDRKSRDPLAKHLPTFVSGSMAAVIYAKADAALQKRNFQFNWSHKIGLKCVQYLVFALLVSVCERGMLLHWFHKHLKTYSVEVYPFISLLVTTFILLEMLSPSELGALFEWNVLRHWGKISFSAYLLHTFVLYTAAIKHQPDERYRLVLQFGLVMALATVSFHVVEYPFQLLAARVSKALNQRGGIVTHQPTGQHKPMQ